LARNSSESQLLKLRPQCNLQFCILCNVVAKQNHKIKFVLSYKFSFKLLVLALHITSVYSWVGRTFFLTGQISLKYCIAGRKKFFALFFLRKDHIIDVNFGYFIHKCIINSLDVHPKFDTGAAENLWRAALWPHLVYSITEEFFNQN